MNCNLTPDEIKEVKTKFSAWLEVQDEKKALADSEKELKKDVAEVIDGKVGDAGKLFKALKQLYDGEENDLDEIGSVLDCIRNNGSGGDDA